MVIHPIASCKKSGCSLFTFQKNHPNSIGLVLVISSQKMGPPLPTKSLIGGGRVHGRRFNAHSCFKKALSFDVKNAKIWNNLGILGGGEVRGQKLTQRVCFQQALELDSKDAKVWYNLGIIGGGFVKDEKFTELECYQKALEFDPELSDAWYHLGLLGGCKVKDEIFGAEACLLKASALDPEIFVETTRPPSECMTTSSSTTEVSVSSRSLSESLQHGVP